MKKSYLIAAFLVLSIGSASPASAGSGVIVETIKAHVEQHQTRTPRVEHRQASAPTSVEQWVRTLLVTLSR